MKRILFLAALALTACDTKVVRETPPTPTPTPKPTYVPPTPVPNKLKGTSLDPAVPQARGKAKPKSAEPKPYVSPLDQRPK